MRICRRKGLGKKTRHRGWYEKDAMRDTDSMAATLSEPGIPIAPALQDELCTDCHSGFTGGCDETVMVEPFRGTQISGVVTAA